MAVSGGCVRVVVDLSVADLDVETSILSKFVVVPLSQRALLFS